MYNKTFKTMDKYPLVFLIAIPTVTIKILSYIFAGFGANSLISSFKLTGDISLLSQSELILYAIISFISIGFLFFLVYPSVLNYINDACNDNVKKGWYKYGLKRNTFRMLHLYILYSAIIGLVLTIVIMPLYYPDAPRLDGLFILFALLASIIIINLQIGTVSVAVEKTIGESFRAFLKFFIVIIFPLYGTMIIFGIPESLLSNALDVGFIKPMDLFKNFSTLFIDYSTVKIVFSIIIFVLSIIANIFTTTFIYTYLTHSYIAERQVYIDSQKKESEMEQIPSNP